MVYLDYTHSLITSSIVQLQKNLIFTISDIDQKGGGEAEVP